MREELHDYYVYPRIVRAGQTTEVAIYPRGRHALNEVEDCSKQVADIELTIIPLEHHAGAEDGFNRYPKVTAHYERGAYRFSWRFEGEQEHYIKFRRNNAYTYGYDYGMRGKDVRLSVYSLNDDLYALRPYRGDLHIHSCESDGREDPGVVAANYRSYGFDFFALTDHGLMYSSKEVCRRYAELPCGMLMMQGEEVHTPIDHIHLVNFGGTWSVNDWARREHKDDYLRMVEERKAQLGELPEGVDATELASYQILCEKVRESGGLAIYPHPHWIENAYNVSDAMTWKLFSDKPFDAFELLGGQTVHENNMQLMIYHEARGRGMDFPVVGSSDSHNSTNTSDHDNTSAIPQATIVFSPALEREAVLDSVRKANSVAVAQYRGEHMRVYGHYRLGKYAMFLINEYFPQHDELCAIEGGLTKRVLEGEEYALPMLRSFEGAVADFTERCFKGWK